MLSKIHRNIADKTFIDSIDLSCKLTVTLFQFIFPILFNWVESVTRRFVKSKVDNNDVNLDMPLFVFPITTNGLLKRMENTQAWNESVTTKSAS